MTEYFPAKNGEYPRIYLKGYSTISNLTSTTMSLHLKVYSRWQSVLGLLQKKGHFCLLMTSYRRVLKSEHPGQQTVFFPASQIFEGIYLMINTIASFWRENTLVYLSLDIICSSKLAVFHQLRSRKTVCKLKQIMCTHKYQCVFSR